MPGLCGDDIARALRARRCAAPILLLSAERDGARVAAACGAAAFMAKPFDVEHLLATIAWLTQQSPG
jgi:DNA-binding response OmpR family regulator